MVSHIYIRWVQVTPDITLKSYTFSKPLDFSRSNSQKNALINAIILIRFSFIILIYNILYLSLISKICIFFSLLSLSHPLHVSLSSIALPSSFSSGFTSIATQNLMNQKLEPIKYKAEVNNLKIETNLHSHILKAANALLHKNELLHKLAKIRL